MRPVKFLPFYEMNHLKNSLTALGLLAALLLTSCAQDGNVRAARTRGAVGGGGLGAIIGNNVSGIGSGEAIIVGAILGAISSEYRLNNPRKVPVIRTIEPGRTYR